MQRSPFPGMDPWLEAHWGDVHTSLCTYTRDQLRPQLPQGLKVRVEEYVTVQSMEDGDFDEARHRFSPDVRITEKPNWEGTESAGIALVEEVGSEPLVIPRLHEPETLRSIRIIDTTSEHRLITSIEFLSRSNKVTKAGRTQYFAKQQAMIDGEVNLVEIDLLRSGPWVMAAPKGFVPPSHRGTYRINVVRASRYDSVEVYRVSLRRNLPTIKIPLRINDQDVKLDLQAIIELVYENGGYDDIDYRSDPDPPLQGDDAAWADELLRSKKLR